MESQYYDGTKLLSLMDKDGNTPSIYLCVGNRTAGKSVFFKRMLLRNYINQGKKFIILYRFNYELSACADMFFNDIGPLFFPGSTMEGESVAKGMFFALHYNRPEDIPIKMDEPVGYALALSNADSIKKYSSFFADVENVFFDEFQSETNHYAPDEIRKFQSLIVSISRGAGKQFRYVRIILASNSVSLLNPYYLQFGIHKMLRDNTKFLKGSGWVLEQTYNETASLAINSSALAKAFGTESYLAYASQNVYLNDNKSFVEKMSGDYKYLCTFKFDNKMYGIKEYFTEEGKIIYVDDKYQDVDLTLTFKGNDHDANMIMLSTHTWIMPYLRKVFEYGKMRFRNLQCKDMIFDVLAIDR